MKKTKTKTEMLRRNGPVIKPWSQSWGQEGSLWWERFVEEVNASQLIHAIFPKVCDLERFQTATVTLMVTQAHWYYYLIGHIMTSY